MGMGDERVQARPYADVPPRSAWAAQMAPDGPERPLSGDAETDVAIVGAGIAGVATAFFALRATDARVLLVERDRVARGATGHNAGQLTTYFERPLFDIADEFGEDLAAEGQRMLDDAHDLLDLVAAECGTTVRVERFQGHMGMFTLNHVTVHLRNNLLRRRHGLRLESCAISEEADFLDRIPAEFTGLYEVVPQARIRELLDDREDRYLAVLSDLKGCANSGAFVQQVLAALERRYPRRFRYHDRTPVERVVVGTGGRTGRGGARVRLHAGGHAIDASSVVLCTNGYTATLPVEDAAGEPVTLAPEQRVAGVVGYMAAFVEDEPRSPAAMSYIRNLRIGGATPYVYVTRRTYDRADGAVTLTCMGGPERPLDEPVYDGDQPFPGAMLDHMDEAIRPYAQPARAPGQPYDFGWHGLMAYSPGKVRVVGAHPRHPALLYNLGCNGVGFLPSVAGAERVSRILAGERLGPSIFDPR